MSDNIITMENVIYELEKLGIDASYPIKYPSQDYICPVCGDSRKPREKKLNINFQKNVFRCNKNCGFEGNSLDFWAFYRGIKTLTYKEIAKDFFDVTRGSKNGNVTEAKHRQRAIHKEVNESPLASTSVRNAAYTELLKMLELTPQHKENLLDRGLDEKTIVFNEYKSAPQGGGKAYVNSLLSRGITIEGVPGFYKNNGEWDFVNFGSGFLIPCRNMKGQIVGMQLRKDTVGDDNRRYFTISSSGKEGGTQGKAFPHFNPGDSSPKQIVITEGPLKGDIISYFSQMPTLSVLGVNNLASVPEYLEFFKKTFKTKKIIIAYDMDIREKKGVQRGFKKLVKMVTQHGFSSYSLAWDENFKGLDDYLLHLHLTGQ